MHIVSRISLATAAALLLTLGLAPIAQAEEGESGGSNSGSGSSSVKTTSSDDSSSDDSDETKDSGSDSARDLQERAKKRLAEAQQKSQEIKTKAEENKAERDAKKTAKLEAKKLEICQKRETVITNIMGRIGDRGQRHLDVVTTISTRVQEFKNSKNLTVANYDALLAAANASKATAQTAVDTVKASQVDFKCDGTDPKGVGTAFKDQAKAMNAAIKAYRDAVKDLVKAVKQANEAANTTPSTTDDDGTADQGQGDN